MNMQKITSIQPNEIVRVKGTDISIYSASDRDHTYWFTNNQEAYFTIHRFMTLAAKLGIIEKYTHYDNPGRVQNMARAMTVPESYQYAVRVRNCPNVVPAP